MNVTEVLEAGADLIDRRGWWQKGESGGGGNSVCASIALSETVARSETVEMDGDFAPHDALLCYLGHAGSYVLNGIYDWNDAPGRTHEEVTSTMRACAALWRARNTQVPEVVSTNSPESVAEYNVVLDLQAK